jgi:2-polyprenyl-3-methyl-5-hydroxy-6-metoxy-1,4-benzoquinol methylase
MINRDEKTDTLRESDGSGRRQDYGLKPSTYFSAARRDYVSELPSNPKAKILEVGCGAGATGALALREGKCGTYCGIELFPEAAAAARALLTEVIAGNVEELELPWGAATFDVLIMSEVIEHLVDPWRCLTKLRTVLKPGAVVFASSPNIAHWNVLTMLLRGRWDWADRGVLDITHLRFFTPRSYRELFLSCGFEIELVKEVRAFGAKARIVNALTLGRLRHLFVKQIDLRGRPVALRAKTAGSGAK